MFNNEKKEKNKKVTGTPYRENELSSEGRQKEDSTKYGEFISSYFGWITLDQQKKRAEELENITKSNKKLEK